MKVVIPAAGKGARLARSTLANTKCMVELNGKRLIDYTLDALELHALYDVDIVTGYQAESLREYLDSNYPQFNFRFINNEAFDTTNNILSMYLALKDIDSDVLIIESDLIFDEKVIQRALKAEGECIVLVDDYDLSMDGGAVKTEGERIKFYRPSLDDIKKGALKTVNIYRFSRNFINNVYLPLLEIYIRNDFINEYYEEPLSLATALPKSRFVIEHIGGHTWHEIDTQNDLDIAKTKFSSDQYQSLMQRWGGYWRFSEINEFNLLVNPFYPSKTFIDQLGDRARELLHSYPSGYEIQRELFANLYKINPKYAFPANGASELIVLLAGNMGKTLILGPTFKEYGNRIANSETVLSIREIEKRAALFESIVIVNPNNPTGGLVKREFLLALMQTHPSIVFYVDESFMDFADESESLLDDETLSDFSNLVIIKSVGKSHGIGGLRLGGIYSSSPSVLRAVECLPIWNINSFSEYYMQNFEMLRKEFESSLKSVKGERKYFYERLNKVKGVKVHKSSGNFLFIELEVGNKTEFVRFLLSRKILLKQVENQGLSGFRVSIKDRVSNDLFIKEVEQYTSSIGG